MSLKENMKLATRLSEVVDEWEKSGAMNQEETFKSVLLFAAMYGHVVCDKKDFMYNVEHVWDIVAALKEKESEAEREVYE